MKFHFIYSNMSLRATPLLRNVVWVFVLCMKFNPFDKIAVPSEDCFMDFVRESLAMLE